MDYAMRRMRFPGVLVAGLLFGCAPVPGATDEQGVDPCRDGLDNDGDGKFDCADEGCAVLTLCSPTAEQSPAACQDGRDNDGDGATDCADLDCRALVVCIPDGGRPPPPCNCDDGIACTNDSCDPQTGICTTAVQAGRCLINRQCYTDGSKNAGQCQVCDAAANPVGWTNIVGGCTIGASCYRKGEKDPTGCLVCEPSRSATSWTPVANPECTVAGQCYAAGERDATGCEICDPAQSTTSLSPATTACTIGGLCFAEAAKHPSSTCSTVICNSSVSSATWTVTGDECLIGGTCYASGTRNPSGCGQCIPSQSKTAWTPATTACTIGAVCYANNDKHPSPTCTSVVCDSSRSTTAWSILGNECLITGVCRQSGDRTSNGCLVCAPTVSKTAWTAVTGGCNIGGSCYDDGDKHPSSACTSVTCNASVSTSAWTVAGNECLIGGSCYAAGAKAPSGCQECNPTLSKTSWSPVASACVIGGACYANGASHPSATCAAYQVTCDAAQSTTTWTVAGNGCVVGNQCYAPGASDATGCARCDPTVSKTSWTPQATCTRILMAALNEAHNGNLGGISGANALCASQATAAGYGGTWRAFLSSSTQNVRDLITGTNATLPVVNLRGENMWSSWNTVFTQPTWNSTAIWLYAFDGRYVNEGQANPDWFDADGWHGSTAAGSVSTGVTCSDWTSAATGVRGANGEWDFRMMFNGETTVCSTTLAVACVLVP